MSLSIRTDRMEIPYTFVFVLLLLAATAFFMCRLFTVVPWFHRENEGFFGGVSHGAGHPDCLRTLPEASQLLDLVQSHRSVKTIPAGQSDASEDYAEMEHLLSKMACLKKDLLSPQGVPDATRSQPFETSHDRLPVAELTGMCMNHTVAPRDLDISFTTWRDRGQDLIRRLCTEGNLTEQEVTQVERLFASIWKDVYSIAQSRCLTTPADQASPGDSAPYEPEHLKEKRSYVPTYGVSASGWNGAV